MISREKYLQIKKELDGQNVLLVAVSKTKPVEDILALYELGQRDFGENYVQELVDKQKQLPQDIRWHFIGHLQRNKVKFLAPFIHLIHGVDSLRLLEEIEAQGARTGRTLRCLLQIHIASEETKFGLSPQEVMDLLPSLGRYPHAQVEGFMGMASFTENQSQVEQEFQSLKKLSDKAQQSNPHLQTLSMGMSADYRLAVQQGSNLVRIGSLLFGARDKA